MNGLEPIVLSRELERIAGLARAWRGRLKQAPNDADQPLQAFRELLGADQVHAVRELHEDDPLRTPLLRWLFFLIEQRVNHAWYTQTHRQRYGQEHRVEQPRRASLTLAQMLHQALTRLPESGAWLASLAARSAELSRLSSVHWQRRNELSLRLGWSGADDVELPEAGVVEAAARWLDQTQELYTELRLNGWAEWLDLALGTQAKADWPARLNEYALLDWFRETRLLEDLPLETEPLPEALGASSFGRALWQLGEAFRVAAAPRHQPFVVAEDPLGLEAACHGALFAGLLANPAFCARRLGLAREALRDHLRVIARVELLFSRSLALKVVLRPYAQHSQRELCEVFQERTATGLGQALNLALGLVLPQLRPNDPQRFIGVFAAERKARAFEERHDEDWFRNPQAADQLRSEAQLSPETLASADRYQAGQSALLKRLSHALG